MTHIKPYHRFVFLIQCSLNFIPLQLKKKKSHSNKADWKMHVSNNKASFWSNNKNTFYERFEIVQNMMEYSVYIFTMNMYLRNTQEWIFSSKDYKTKPKKKKPIKYINKNNIITSNTFNNLGLKQNLTFWWCRGLSIA